MKKVIEKLDDDTNKILKTIIKQSKQNIKKDGECSPMAFFVTSDGVVGAPIPLNAVPKELCFKMIATMAEDIDAHVTILVMEAWALDSLTKEEFEEHIRSGSGVSSHPKKKEILSYSVFTPANVWLGTLRIDSEKKEVLESGPIFVEAKDENLQGNIMDAMAHQGMVH